LITNVLPPFLWFTVYMIVSLLSVHWIFFKWHKLCHSLCAKSEILVSKLCFYYCKTIILAALNFFAVRYSKLFWHAWFQWRFCLLNWIVYLHQLFSWTRQGQEICKIKDIQKYVFYSSFSIYCLYYIFNYRESLAVQGKLL